MARTYSFAALLAVLIGTSVQAQRQVPPRLGPEDGLLAVRVNGKYGFIDLTGRIVIPPTFDMAWQFSEGRASAWQGGRAGFIDRTGQFAIPPRFEYARAFHEGLAEVQLGGRWGFVGMNGQLAIQPQFEETRWFSEGRAPVRVGAHWGYVDAMGNFIIPALYQQAAVFENGRALVQLEGQWTAIDRNGAATARDPNDLIPEQRDGKWGFVRPDGSVAIRFNFDGAQGFSEGLAAVEVTGRWGFIDRSGRMVISPQYEDGWAPPRWGARGGPPIGPFKEGVAAAYQDGSWRFIDTQGRLAIPREFAKVVNFQNGVAQVCGPSTCGYIDRAGRAIWPWE